MNRGNTNKDPESSPNKLDRLNQALARLMGKKDSSLKDNSVPSNNKFLLIVLAMLLGMWFLTGIYYVPEGNYGLILESGKVSRVTTGVRVGITLPYPLADVVTLDATPNKVSFGGSESMDQAYTIATNDQEQLNMAVKFSYLISDPQKYYISYYQENSNLDLKISWLLKTILQDYFVHYQSQQILQNSTIVMSNEIRQISASILAGYGLQIDKLEISKISKVNKNINTRITDKSYEQSLTESIVNEAILYKNNKAQETRDLTDQFNQLLPQYIANPKVIKELMYYKMLSNIPAESAPSYSLLSLTLGQFLDLVNNRRLNGVAEEESRGLRLVDRSIDRERIFKGR